MIEDLRDEMFEKLKKGLKTKYINDLELMKDFNNAGPPEKQAAVFDQLFDELTRVLLEFKLMWSNEYNFTAATNRLDFKFMNMMSILRFDYEEAQKRRASI